VAYGKLGNSGSEINSYKEAIRIDPDFAPAHYNLGYALFQRGEKAAALDEYKILKGLDEDAADKLFNLIYY
jgi:tetratricopeptide (TPR) repeat protein